MNISRLLRQSAVLTASASIIARLPACAQPVQLKPPMRGLISMGNISFHRTDDGVPNNSLQAIATRPGAIQGVVINVTWAQLQPAPDVLDTGAIDQGLAAVRDYNTRNASTPLAVKLRIWAGPNAPTWAKTIGGPPVKIQSIAGPQAAAITVGRFWSPP